MNILKMRIRLNSKYKAIKMFLLGLFSLKTFNVLSN